MQKRLLIWTSIFVRISLEEILIMWTIVLNFGLITIQIKCSLSVDKTKDVFEKTKAIYRRISKSKVLHCHYVLNLIVRFKYF